MFGQGEQWKFGLKLDRKYGEGTSRELEEIARTTVKFMRIEIEENILYYKTLVKNLKTEKEIE